VALHVALDIAHPEAVDERHGGQGTGERDRVAAGTGPASPLAPNVISPPSAYRGRLRLVFVGMGKLRGGEHMYIGLGTLLLIIILLIILL
jgi:hypothetical protein